MFDWLKKGLSKSSAKIAGGLDNIFNKKVVTAETLEELEEVLLESDVGVAATSKIIESFKQNKFAKDVESVDIKKTLAGNIAHILSPCESKLEITQCPHVILLAGVNGAGKTTVIGKLAHKFKGKKISFIAGDTFRAAAVEQIKVWADRCGVKVYTAPLGGDAASLCFDGLSKAIADGDELVFIDTAGRLQNKTDLNNELKKIIRVIKKVIPSAPHHTLLCLDAATGQNAIEQVKIFKEIADINGLIINKLDGTAKGGVLLAIAQNNSIPVYYLGVGEGIDDLIEFKATDYAQALLGISN